MKQLFWTTYVVGSLVFVFAFLLSRAPRPLKDVDYTLDYICWFGAAIMMLICILIARRTWKIRNPFLRRGPINETSALPPRGPLVVTRVAWVEFIYSVLVIVSIAVNP